MGNTRLVKQRSKKRYEWEDHGNTGSKFTSNLWNTAKGKKKRRSWGDTHGRGKTQEDTIKCHVAGLKTLTVIKGNSPGVVGKKKRTKTLGDGQNKEKVAAGGRSSGGHITQPSRRK